MGYAGVVFVPEPREGVWETGESAYTNQVVWERKHLDMADVIVAWVPRQIPQMAGLTTNIEMGIYLSSDKIVFGAPEWAKSVRYLETMLKTETGGERHLELRDTLRAAVERVSNPTVRRGGERAVPLHIWKLPSFQNWYTAQTAAGNRLDDAKLLWHFRPPKAKAPFSFILWVNVWIENEGRHKSNEYIFTRPDISTVVLYHFPSKDRNADSLFPPAGMIGLSEILEAEIVLVREFRSPARTEDGFIRELAGGSSVKPGKDPLQVASDEVHEETGLVIPADRFKPVGSRQVAGTVSTHHSHLFAAELTAEEMAQAKTLAAEEEAHGVVEDTERTYVEVTTVKNLLGETSVDWSTLGMVLKALMP
jgi:8-oxo-dGTP pyrophosphatase MutT (NUDIX family)